MMTENEKKFYKALKEAIYYGTLIGVDTESIGLEELERRFSTLHKKEEKRTYIEVSD